MNEQMIPIIVAIIAALPGLWAMSSQRKQTEASATGAITDAAVDIVKEYKDQFEKLVFEVNEAKTTAQLSADRIYQLEKQLKQLEGQIDILQKQNTDLRREVEVLRLRVREYRQGIVSLINQIEGLGQHPAYELKLGDE